MLIYNGYSQQDQRRYVKYTDQHGRKWGVNVEKKTGDPVGHWDHPNAPIVPGSQYLKVSTDPDKPNALNIDYDRLIADGRQAILEWEKEAMRLMRSRHRNLYREDMEIDIDIADIVGPKPPAVEPWIAAKQGEPWILGLTNKVNLKVAAFMDLDKKKEHEEPNFLDEENFLDVEEQFDAEALGGKRVPVNKGGRPKGSKNKPKDDTDEPLNEAA